MSTPTLDNFESALMAELRVHVAERSAVDRGQVAEIPVTNRGRRPFLRTAAPIAAAVAVAGGIALGLVGPSPSPAYAVERLSDGDVVVTVTDLVDAAGLERALQREGVAAEVTYLADATLPSDLDRGFSAACPPVGDVIVDPADNGGVTFTLAAEFVQTHDHVLQLTAAGGRTEDDWTAVNVHWAGAC